MRTEEENKIAEKQREGFKEACKPLMKFLCENYYPHVKVIIDGNTAELLEGVLFEKNNEFIVD
jgi:hypothetical protein